MFQSETRRNTAFWILTTVQGHNHAYTTNPRTHFLLISVSCVRATLTEHLAMTTTLSNFLVIRAELRETLRTCSGLFPVGAFLTRFLPRSRNVPSPYLVVFLLQLVQNFVPFSVSKSHHSPLSKSPSLGNK